MRAQISAVVMQLVGSLYTSQEPANRDSLLRLLYYIEYKEHQTLPHSLVQTYIFFVHLRRFLINLSNHCLVNQLFRDAVSEQVAVPYLCLLLSSLSALYSLPVLPCSVSSLSPLCV